MVGCTENIALDVKRLRKCGGIYKIHPQLDGALSAHMGRLYQEYMKYLCNPESAALEIV